MFGLGMATGRDNLQLWTQACRQTAAGMAPNAVNYAAGR